MANFERNTGQSSRFVTRNQVGMMDSFGSTSMGSRISSGSSIWAPYCDCDVKAVLRTAGTAKNEGKKFWGCRYYKHNSGRKKDKVQHCDFFEWFCDDVEGQKELGMQRQRRKIMALTVSLKDSRRCNKILACFCILLLLMNFLFVLMMWSLGDRNGNSVKMYLR